MSTVISDFVLAAVCLFAIARLRGPAADSIPARLLGWGLLLAALAAGVGAARFAGFGDLAETHVLLSQMAGQVGVPLIGLAFLSLHVEALRQEQTARFIPLGLMLIFGAFEFYLDVPGWRLIAGLFGVTLVITVCIGRFASNATASALGVAGAAGIVIAGLVIGAQGEWLGLPRIDWFHYALAASYFALAESLRMFWQDDC